MGVVGGLTRTVELRLGAPPRGCAIDMAVMVCGGEAEYNGRVRV
jgi:hypothetical protein